VDRALVFTRTKHGADKVVKGLARANIAAQEIHGNKSQNHRERTLADFRSGTIRTLVATDIAARGIDVEGISHVVNFDLPNIPETYVHRIGRTARAGTDGIAISLVDADEVAYLRDIEKLIRQALPREDMRTGDNRSHAERTGDTRNHQGRANNGRHHQAQRGHRQDGRGGPQRHGAEVDHAASPRRPQGGHLNGARTPNPNGDRGNRNGGRHGSQQPAPRQAAGGGSHESIQAVAFMARESRPARPPEHRKRNKSRSHSHGRPHDARQPHR
jgi:ATP-dependent RNA helicase RhlE